MSKTTIEWTEHTWNPTTGCDKVSEGCDNCYALAMSKRLKAMGNSKYQNDGDPKTSGSGFGFTCHPDALDEVTKRKKPTTYFVNSMSDLFHASSVSAGRDGELLDEWQFKSLWLHRVFEQMSRAEQHTFQVLTKRPQLMAEWFRQAGAPVGRVWPLDNVWLGTSIELNKYSFRANHLRDTPAAVRFLSLEPLLGPLPSLDLTDIDWVIVGGESGPGARPMHPGWVVDIRDQCVDAGIPFTFKQWGAWSQIPLSWAKRGDKAVRVLGRSGDVESVEDCLAEPPGTAFMRRVGKKKAGRLLDGKVWDEMPERVTS